MIRDIKFGLVPNGYSGYDNRPLYNSADSSLLLIEQVYKYLKYTNDNEFIKDEIYPSLVKIMDAYSDRVDVDGDNIYLDKEDNLLSAGTENTQITWMDVKIDNHAITPRNGKTVELNALWYNALRFVADLVREGGDAIFADVLDAQAEVTGKSFVDVFRNEYGYLLDYVDGNMMDWSVRPNMIFTVAFDYSPLDARQKKGVLDVVTKELLTPKGLRSLSPKSGGYNPNYVGPQMQRDYAYHQGTAWPWLAGFYFEAYLRIYKMSALGFIERQLIGYEDEMVSHCIGSIPELFDGNPPFKGRGAVSFAMNVAEILRVLYLLSKYNY